MGLFKSNIPKDNKFIPRGQPQKHRRWIEIQPDYFIQSWNVDYLAVVENSEGNRWRLKAVIGQTAHLSEPSENKEEIKKLVRLFF
jgi:hypothetical protein